MKRRVYLKACVFSDTENFAARTNSDTDGISAMCIYVLEKLAVLCSGSLPKNAPLFFGSAYSSLKSLHTFNCVCEREGALAVNPRLFPRAVLTAPSCRAGIEMRITEPVYNIMNGEASEFSALMLASAFIGNGTAESAVVCTAEECYGIAASSEGGQFTDRCGALLLTAAPAEWEWISACSDSTAVSEVQGCRSVGLTGELMRQTSVLTNAAKNTHAGIYTLKAVGREAVYMVELLKRH